MWVSFKREKEVVDRVVARLEATIQKYSILRLKKLTKTCEEPKM
jgi:hypothetical protein